MPSDKARSAARARLAALDKSAAADSKAAAKEAMRRKKNVLRTKAAMGDRKTRQKAASELSSMPKPSQWKD